ncbi:DUF2510 domain-containing protein [Microbacterium sp. JAI119]|uniref:DUF2510 domain-containing protein n=2 Tax=unclassified Microbacterium TaxID=2609290 RepID=UPI0015C92597|nr:DUF2510 domain-containing protein [Microbacterium sp. JAI119]NYF28658.1 uncharacterized membrane protein (DUF485 family) [Microbacterium sp. JAI119]
MTTPAGWYDDGSGRQRWWDGQQWTEHFAPEATDAGSASEEPNVSETTPIEDTVIEETVIGDTVIEDTVIRPSEETVIIPEERGSSAAADQGDVDAAGATAATTPLGDDLGAYSAPAAPPAYPAAAPGQSTDAYPGVAPAYPGTTTGYPTAAPYGQPVSEEPKKLSVLGLVGLGVAALGTILVFIPVVGFIGFVLLAAAFVVSLISLFLKGKKWPGIAGLVLAVVGTIIGIIMSFVYLFAFAQGVSEEIDKLPTSSPSIEASAPPESEGPDAGVRPTSPEVAQGLTAILASSGAEGYTEPQVSCLADLLVASDLDNATLRTIADSDGNLTDTDALYGVAEVLSDTEAITACLVP